MTTNSATPTPPADSLPFRIVEKGTLTSPRGFRVGAVCGDIKYGGGRKDVALIISDFPAEAAATFTTNQVKAAPVRVSMRRMKRGKMRGVIVNAGNANACTGVEGLENAKEMVKCAAKAVGCDEREMLVCSTGRIGVQLPMDKVRKAITDAHAALGDNGHSAAEAIMTTDTFPKELVVEFELDGATVRIAGIAKGAGMIHPKMATMLSFITTDAAIDKATLRSCVQQAVDFTFNRISIDGDTSTNDTVIVLANGQAGNETLTSDHKQVGLFQKALQYVMKKLARMIVEDGEGISKIVEVAVKGGKTMRDAKSAALAVARSMLVKTSWCGEDPNWGRLMDAIGYSDARVREELVEIYYDGILAVANGQPSKTPFEQLRKVAQKKSFTITIQLHLGDGEYNIVTTDLTEKYVELNKGE
ncbi:MAG: bifunctional glutamate N-acetyltransferase/amino-acid acetyltransferase ArgJ [Candidatus Methylacidiphilales bacterium]|nr:bifunctional glutamate N-acetyltransferase/amino-acid acetyltransferase ArgJ [Candidatus Methylacidiphilales bacterium]